MKPNTSGGFLNSRGVNIALGSLLALNWLCVALGVIIFGYSYLAWNSYQSLYRNWEFESEKNVRDWIVPRLVQENALKECPVKHAAFGCTHFRIDAASPDQYEKITEDIIRLERPNRSVRTNQVYILEFDHDSESRGLTVGFFTPDAINDPPQAWRTPALWENAAE